MTFGQQITIHAALMPSIQNFKGSCITLLVAEHQIFIGLFLIRIAFHHSNEVYTQTIWV